MEYPQLDLENVKGPKAVIKTNHGDIKVQLFEKEAPMTVENFIRLAKKGYYDNTTFHRVISDFMIQGGDPKGDGTGGESIWGHPFEDEFSNKLFNLRGALSMANSGPNTNGSQFFIVQKDSTYLDGNYAAFGKVIHGMDVVDKIADVKVDDNDKPLSEQKMLSVRFVNEYNPENVTQKEGE